MLINLEDNNVQDVLSCNNIPANASILNTKRDPNRTTEKYLETNDLGIVQEFNKHGWYIVDYQEVKTHKTDRQGFQKYLATYENPDLASVQTEKGKARLLQRGAHDGTALLEVHAGFFTWACSNGLIVGDALFEPFKVKHIGDIGLEIGKAITKFAETCPLIFSKVDKMTKQELTNFQAMHFAKQAAKMRFKDENAVDINAVLKARRSEDDNLTLWNVFNKVQENLIKPTSDLKLTTKDNKQRKARPLTNIDTKVKLNRDLWHLAEEYLIH
jgi:hypothetical protein